MFLLVDFRFLIVLVFAIFVFLNRCFCLSCWFRREMFLFLFYSVSGVFLLRSRLVFFFFDFVSFISFCERCFGFLVEMCF